MERGGLPGVIDQTAAFDRALAPARVFVLVTGTDPTSGRALQEPATEEQLVEMFGQARSLHQNSWIAMAIVCGEAISRVGADRMGYRRLSKALGVHKTEVVRLVDVYRGVIRPRLERDGDGALFPLQQQTYYVLACEAARHSQGKATALELIERVEAKRTGVVAPDDPTPRPTTRYTTAEFRNDLVADGLLRRPEAEAEDAAERLLAALRTLADAPPDVIERAGYLGLPDEAAWRERVTAAAATMGAFEDELDAAVADARAMFASPPSNGHAVA